MADSSEGTSTNYQFKSCILFGGNGFIGSHLAADFLANNIVEHITIADIVTATPDKWPKNLQLAFAAGKINYVKVDVCETINNEKLPTEVDLIVNLAAVHKEPGHESHEYFETNIPGAENVCTFAEKVNCKNIIFTSSIATYDGKPGPKDEHSLTMPLTPYGVSKLTAEKIHLAWQRAESGRKLMIVRPGVIFGPGEKGNVTRMVKAVMGHYFFFSGNQSVRKAGGYVKELCHSILFMMKHQNETNSPVVLFNFTMDPAPTIKDYANGIQKVTGVTRAIPNVPFKILLTGAYFVNVINKILGRKQSISPVTIRKTLKYNDIIPKVLEDLHYEYKYTLDEGLADWYKERPQEW